MKKDYSIILQVDLEIFLKYLFDVFQLWPCLNQELEKVSSLHPT